MKYTKLEKHLFFRSGLIIIKWAFCLAFILYCIYRVFLVEAFIIFLWLWFTSFGCCENGYIPRYHYFLRYRFSHSYEERLRLSNQYESNEYIKIGEGVFLENYLLFADFGVTLLYSEIERISLNKHLNLNVVSVVLKSGRKYAFNISEVEYKSTPSLYQKAISYFQCKIEQPPKIKHFR